MKHLPRCHLGFVPQNVTEGVLQRQDMTVSVTEKGTVCHFQTPGDSTEVERSSRAALHCEFDKQARFHKSTTKTWGNVGDAEGKNAECAASLPARCCRLPAHCTACSAEPGVGPLAASEKQTFRLDLQKICKFVSSSKKSNPPIVF